MTTELSRFWSKVDKGQGCWTWTASVTSGGYGRFKIRGKTVAAHRWIYESDVGPIPDGLQLDHLCRTRNCVRPEHMEPVTCQVNLLRGDTIQARNSEKTHCLNGHEFTQDNIIIRGGQWRECRACNRTRSRDYQRTRLARLKTEREQACVSG